MAIKFLDSHKYSKDIKKLAGIRENYFPLPNILEADRIPKSRGVGFMDNSGAIQSFSGGGSPPASDTDPKSPSTVGSTQGGDADKTGEQGETDSGEGVTTNSQGEKPKGSGGGSLKKEKAETAATDFTGGAGLWTAEEILTDNLGPQLNGTGIAADGTVFNENSNLKELITKDCDSGKQMRIRTDGEFPPPVATFEDQSEEDQEGKTALTPQWEDPDDPPGETHSDDNFYSVFFTNTSVPGENHIVSFAATHQEALDIAINLEVAKSGAVDVQLTALLTTPTTYRVRAVDENGDLVGSNTKHETQIKSYTDPNFSDILDLIAPGSGIVDDGEEKPFTSWPLHGFYDRDRLSEKLDNTVDESFILSVDGNDFLPHPLDPNVPNDRKAGSSVVHFCYGANDAETGAIEKTKNGFLLFKTGANGAIATGSIAQVYDSEGALSGYTDAAGLDSFR